MRIRKRQVPFPLSDLNLNWSPPVAAVQHNENHHEAATPQPQGCYPVNNLSLEVNTTAQVHHKPSDQTNHRSSPIGSKSNGSDFLTPDGAHMEKKRDCLDKNKMMQNEEREEDKKREKEEEKKSNDTRKGSIFGAETATEVLPLSSSPQQVVIGRWGEGEKAFPLKKRRGSLGGRSANVEPILGNEEEIYKKAVKTNNMKTKVNKKCGAIQQNDNEQEEEDSNGITKEATAIDINNNSNSSSSNKSNSAKKRGRGGALMEGSRCSRVNGRGWRCCQQTLVGYSLCEHHLGKGRLRSMTSVPSRSPMATNTSSTAQNKKEKKKIFLGSSSSSSGFKKQVNDHYYDDDDDDDGGDHEDEKKKPLMVTKKRMKLGMVKARSLSSLLGQTNTAVVGVVDDINKSNHV